jgi:hypothetical protein
VTVVAAQVNERIVGGAVLHRGAAVTGISNLFIDDEIAPLSWRGCLATASALLPGETLVSYETGDALATAARHGFHPVGPLRVWLR